MLSTDTLPIRWLIRRDMPEVLDIERASFDVPWTEDDFLERLRQRNCIGMVAEHEQQIVGFMIYELHKSQLVLLNLAVAPDWRRRGVGTALIARLKDKLSQQRRKRIVARLSERNFDGHLFFRSQRFRAIGTERDYHGPGHDAYVFNYRLPVQALTSD